jgi:hypothetical protein
VLFEHLDEYSHFSALTVTLRALRRRWYEECAGVVFHLSDIALPPYMMSNALHTLHSSQVHASNLNSISANSEYHGRYLSWLTMSGKSSRERSATLCACGSSHYPKRR